MTSRAASALRVGTPVVAAGLLWMAFRTPPGWVWTFAAWSLATAAVWIGAWFLERRLRPAPSPVGPRLVGEAVLIGAALAAASAVAVRIALDRGWLGAALGEIHVRAHAGNALAMGIVTALAGAGEELFWRDTVHAAVAEHRGGNGQGAWWLSALAAGAVTVVTGNWLLVAGAVVLGLVAAWHRRRSGTVITAVIIHLAWSVTMFAVLRHTRLAP